MDLTTILWNTANTLIATIAVYFTWRYRRKDDSNQAKRAAGSLIQALEAFRTIVLNRYPKMNPNTVQVLSAFESAIAEARYHKSLFPYIDKAKIIREKSDQEIAENSRLFGVMVRPRETSEGISNEISLLIDSLDHFIVK